MSGLSLREELALAGAGLLAKYQSGRTTTEERQKINRILAEVPITESRGRAQIRKARKARRRNAQQALGVTSRGDPERLNV